MVTASSIGAGKGGDYGRYLESKTVEPERGDYYLNPTGEPVQAPGRWLADEDTLRTLGITAGQPVVGGDFIAVMDGRHPVSGEWLRPEGAGGGRAAGIDVTFSAPKSVSAVWALADPWQRETIEAAHANAVEQAVGYMRDEIQVVRRRRDNIVVHETARDLIAAVYVHTTARGVSGADVPDPQLHSHVVISGVIRQDGRIAAVSSRPIFRSAREVGAYYRAALAWELRSRGYAGSRRPGITDGISSSRMCRCRCGRSSPSAPARSRKPQSVFAPSTGAPRSATSCAISSSRTAKPNSSPPAETSNKRGSRPHGSTASDPTKPRA